MRDTYASADWWDAYGWWRLWIAQCAARRRPSPQSWAWNRRDLVRIRRSCNESKMKPGTGAITPMLTFPSATESTKTKDTSIKTQKCTLQMNTYILQVVCQKHGAVQLEIWNDGLHPAWLQLLPHQSKGWSQFQGGGGCNNIRVVVGQQDH